MKTGAQLIAEERERQISQEGWTEEKDAGYSNPALSQAAICYARQAGRHITLSKATGEDNPTMKLSPPIDWPWDKKWWKPSTPLRDLVKAGALIAAEIDRLQRKKSNPELSGGTSAPTISSK